MEEITRKEDGSDGDSREGAGKEERVRKSDRGRLHWRGRKITKRGGVSAQNGLLLKGWRRMMLDGGMKME